MDGRHALKFQERTAPTYTELIGISLQILKMLSRLQLLLPVALGSVRLLSMAQNWRHLDIPISREELFRLHDVADGLRLLRDIADQAPEMQLVQAELLIKKTSQAPGT
jgi:hypothetical protein